MLLWCERLENRVLLSASGGSLPAMALQGTYAGTLHVNAGGSTRHALSIYFATDGAWPLSGSLDAAGIGTFHFAGSSDGKAARLVFAADTPGAGEIIVRRGPGNTLRGMFTENIGARTLHGTFALAAGTAAAGGGSAVRLGKVRASQPNLTGTYQSVARSSRSVSLTLSGESLSGLVAGTLAVAARTFSTTGIVRGNELDLVLAGGTATFTRSGASIRGRIHMGTDHITVLLVNHGAKTREGRAGGSNGTASSGNTTSASSGSSASLAGTTGQTVGSSDASTSLVVSGLGEFVNIGSLTAFGSGASNPFGNLNNITTATPTSSTTIGVPGTGSTGVIASGGSLPSSGNTNGSPTATGSGFTTGVGASPPVGSTTTVPGTSSGVVGSVPVAPTNNPASGGDLYGTPIYGTGSPGFQ